MSEPLRDFRKVPQADECAAKMPLRKPDLLNHLISPDEERGRHGKPKRFGGFEVYNEFKFGRLDDWR